MFSLWFSHAQVANSAEEFATAQNLSFEARLRFYELVKQELGVRENKAIQGSFERVFQMLRQEYANHYQGLFIGG